MLATDNWCIKVYDKIYGPYTSEQLALFVDEGRITQKSLIAPAGGNSWKTIIQYTNFSNLFPKNLGHIPAKSGHSGNPSAARASEGENAHFVIIFDTVSGAATRLEGVIREIGPAIRLMDNTWAVSSNKTLTSIKNTVAPHLHVREPVFIIDTTRGKTAWQNFVPEIHSKLIKAWSARLKIAERQVAS